MLHLAYNIVVYCWLVSVVPVFPHTHIHTHTHHLLQAGLYHKSCVQSYFSCYYSWSILLIMICNLTHTHTHTHTHTIHTHTHVHTCTCTHMHTHANICTRCTHITEEAVGSGMIYVSLKNVTSLLALQQLQIFTFFLSFPLSFLQPVTDSRLGPTNPDSNYFFKVLLGHIKALR